MRGQNPQKLNSAGINNMLAYQFSESCGTPIYSQDTNNIMLSVPANPGCGIVQVETSQVDYSITAFDAELAMFYVGGALLMETVN